jgi:polysaccharide pyruvyl transferase WcaK-like protein
MTTVHAGADRERAALRPGTAPPRPTGITLFGIFGAQNLGNECTLQAMLQHARRRVPNARIHCICSNPSDTSARHDVCASPMSGRPRGGSRRGRAGDHPAVRLLRAAVVRVPAEIRHCITAFQTLKASDMLVMTGTGMVGEFGIRPFDLHYEILKWSIIAKLRGCRVLFVSVGGGALASPLSRWLVKAALSLADYRSYRDAESKTYVDSLGVDTRGDGVYPDLAFSLPPLDDVAAPARGTEPPVIGVGLMDYYGAACRQDAGEQTYRAYVETVTTFVAWLLHHGYRVRLVIGDVKYDTRVRQDVLSSLRARGTTGDSTQLLAEPIRSVDELLAQLAGTDLVVATRFHNVLLALMLKKPVLSISYHPKNDSLMRAVGLGDYCQPIDRLDVDRLIAQFRALERNKPAVISALEPRIDEYRRRLDEQYTAIFGWS